MDSSAERMHKLAALAAGLAIWGVLCAAALSGWAGVSAEAGIRDVMCRRLLASTTDGRQSLVSSIWWAPLPTLVRLPVAFALGSPDWPLASLIVSASFGAGILALGYALLRRWNPAARSVWLIAGLAAHPLFLAECVNGSSNTLIAILAMTAGVGLASWVAGRKLRSLTVAAVGSALLLISSAEMVPWVLAAMGLLALSEWIRRGERGERRAVLILALFPAVYAVGLWMLSNWLIMGDALYFVRSLFRPGLGPAALPLRHSVETQAWLLCAGMAAISLLLSARCRDRAGLVLSLLALAPVVGAALLAARNYLWEAAPALFSLIPLGILSLGRAIGCTGTPRALRAALGCLPLVLAGGAWILTGGGEALRNPPESALPGAEGSVWLPRIQREVAWETPFAKVFVCGYSSFQLLGSSDRAVFVHSLDFNFYKAAEDYVGHSLYLLVRRPEGRFATDSIYWHYRDLFTAGARSTLYYADWGPWRLFEIVQGRREHEADGLQPEVLPATE